MTLQGELELAQWEKLLQDAGAEQPTPAEAFVAAKIHYEDVVHQLSTYAARTMCLRLC